LKIFLKNTRNYFLSGVKFIDESFLPEPMKDAYKVLIKNKSIQIELYIKTNVATAISHQKSPASGGLSLPPPRKLHFNRFYKFKTVS
jgi:hypothetical protein